jgi:hypothetical protein
MTTAFLNGVRDRSPSTDRFFQWAGRLGACLLAAGLLLAAALVPAVQAQTPATTIKDGSGTVVFQSNADGSILAPGEFLEGGLIPAEGAGTRLMWYPFAAAFRAGRVGNAAGKGDVWDADSLGSYSVAFGVDTKASNRGTVAMGDHTSATGDAAVAMGEETVASGINAVALGWLTIASDRQATALGKNTTADGRRSLVAGRDAKALHDDTFVWGDGSSPFDDRFSSGDDENGSGVTGEQTFHVQASGGARFVTFGGTTYIPSNSTGWSTTSSRDAKTDIETVAPNAVLAAVEGMPIHTWEYRTETGGGQGTRHIGPMAGDFHEALPYDLGNSDAHINSINADGVALGAIKGLAQRVAEQKQQIDTLTAEKQALATQQKKLEARVAALEAERASSTVAGLTSSRGGLLLVFFLGGLFGAGLLWRRRS